MRRPHGESRSDIAAIGTGRSADVSARWNSAPLLTVIQFLALVAMTATVATRYWQDHVWFGWGIAALSALVWLPELRRPVLRVRVWWFGYVAGIFIYTLLRSYADDTGIPVRARYVVEVDQLLFLGVQPVHWLQERLFVPHDLSWLDYLVVQVHWSFFVVPHAAAVAIFLFRREQFARYALAVVATMYAGLLLFFLVPTAPPWLAARSGDLPHVWRIMDVVGGRVDGETYEAFYASLGEPNSVAAMPSIHIAVTFLLFLWARHYARRLAVPALLYTFAMAFALVYMAEHYVLDLAVGALVAWLCYIAAGRLVDAWHDLGAAGEPVSLRRLLVNARRGRH
ncbi:MAG: hypothetical protein Kow0010_07400 [Dehalococcoidia bacterium]